MGGNRHEIGRELTEARAGVGETRYLSLDSVGLQRRGAGQCDVATYRVSMSCVRWQCRFAHVGFTV